MSKKRIVSKSKNISLIDENDKKNIPKKTKKKVTDSIKELNINEKKDTKCIFILKNVDANNLDQRYGLNSMTTSKIPENVTKISDLSSHKHETITFLDDSKKTRIGNLLMVDVNNINHSGQYHCFWDHHPIGRLKPIGCPVEYVFSQAVRDYISEISKNRYIIRENLSLKTENPKNVNVIEQNYYLTDGVFCSFNCCLAFIKANIRTNIIYKNSEMLLYQMYHDFFGKSIEKITPANHWRTLLVYGGKLTIEKFRNNLESVEYNFQGTIKMRSIAHVYEEKYKL
jgi:hypothetical protein